jgi:hypothetical protein
LKVVALTDLEADQLLADNTSPAINALILVARHNCLAKGFIAGFVNELLIAISTPVYSSSR